MDLDRALLAITPQPGRDFRSPNVRTDHAYDPRELLDRVRGNLGPTSEKENGEQ